MNPIPAHDPRRTATEALARREAGWTEADADAFARWRQAAPENEAAAAEVEAMHRKLAAFRESPAAASLLAEADQLVQKRRVVWFPRMVVWTTIAAAAACVLLAVRLIEQRTAIPAPYTIAADSPRTIDLPDGSTVQLGAASSVEIAFGPAERHVTLRQGNGHFSVARDTERPFVVAAGAVRVRAVGTAFDVRRVPDAVEVRVTEGKVRVTATESAGLAQPLFLVAGEGATISRAVAASSPTSPSTAAPAAARFAHPAPRLTFSNTPLAEVIGRFNQYSRVQVELADAELAKRGVGGTFEADQAEAFVDLLTASGDVRVERVSETHLVLHRSR